MRAALIFVVASLSVCKAMAAESVPPVQLTPDAFPPPLPGQVDLATYQFSIAGHAVPTGQQMQRAVLFDRDPNKVETLLKAGFNPSSPIGCGTFDSLDGAVDIESVEIVNVLLLYGARPKESTFVQAALLPVFDNAVDIIAAFLGAGADVNSKMHYSERPTKYWTALDFAVSRQNTKLVQLLLSRKGIALNDVDGDGWTALEIARNKGDASLVAMLLQAGADTHITGWRRGAALASRALQ